MSLKNNSTDGFKPCDTKSKIFAFIVATPTNCKEIHEEIKSLQKANAGLREQLSELFGFIVEQSEDNAEIKRILQDLKRNNLWFARERI